MKSPLQVSSAARKGYMGVSQAAALIASTGPASVLRTEISVRRDCHQVRKTGGRTRISLRAEASCLSQEPLLPKGACRFKSCSPDHRGMVELTDTAERETAFATAKLVRNKISGTRETAQPACFGSRRLSVQI